MRSETPLINTSEQYYKLYQPSTYYIGLVGHIYKAEVWLIPQLCFSHRDELFYYSLRARGALILFRSMQVIALLVLSLSMLCPLSQKYDMGMYVTAPVTAPCLNRVTDLPTQVHYQPHPHYEPNATN